VKRQEDLDLIAQLQAENLSLAEKLRLAEEEAHRNEQAAIEANDKINSQRSIIEESQMAIHRHEQDIMSWMSLCEWYQTKCLQCSSVLEQMIAFLQGTMPAASEVGTWPTTQSRGDTMSSFPAEVQAELVQE
jgi:hypothetical protein